MMLLFSLVVGSLLTLSYLGFYALLVREVRAQVDRQLLEAAGPVVADLNSDPNDEDVAQFNLPDEYFEILDPSSGRVLQRSRNLTTHPLAIGGEPLDPSRIGFRTLEDRDRGRLRLALVPLVPRPGSGVRILAFALSTRDADLVLGRFRHLVLVLLPFSLVVTGLVSTWYVGRSLRPITELTRRAAETTERVGSPGPQALWTPFAVSNPSDEVGLLAETFNRLFVRVDSALRQLRQFVSDASHELRTPLSILQGETELLLAEPRSTEQYQKALGVIDEELKKLSRIVEGLFTLAMADAGQLRLAREPVYLNEVLEEACERISPRARAKKIDIERALRQEVAYLGDETFLRQLFLIFLENSVKYSPPHTRVRVNLRTVDSRVRISFEDQGTGISKGHLPRIFERFYRVANADAGEAQSGGLGLAIAQAITRSMGGSVECESTPGQGSTFTVNLPLEPSAPSGITS
jgi:two-component system heavy metal sensor histidine kinase CusS